MLNESAEYTKMFLGLDGVELKDVYTLHGIREMYPDFEGEVAPGLTEEEALFLLCEDSMLGYTEAKYIPCEPLIFANHNVAVDKSMQEVVDEYLKANDIDIVVNPADVMFDFYLKKALVDILEGEV